MKRAGSLRVKLVYFLSFLFLTFSGQSAVAATYSLVIPGGSAAYGSVPWGQTFTVPSGKSGTISSISGMTLASYCNTVADVMRIKIYDSPSKATLLATSTADYTLTKSSGCTFAPNTAVTANFSPFQVIENTQYYFEASRVSGNSSNLYFFENSTNPYSGGSAYHGGVLNAAYDLGMTINIDFTAGPVAISLGLTSGASQATYRTTSQLKASTNTASTVTFYANKKVIPGCRKIATSSNIAYCNWRPSNHGALVLTATAVPLDSANYSTNSVSTQVIGVSARSNTR